MQKRIDDLERELKQGLAPLYVVHGDEALLALEAADLIRHAARTAGYAEREVLTVEGSFDWSRLLEAAGSVSLFADRKLLEIRIPSGKPGTDGAAALAAFAVRLPGDTITLVQLPRLDKAQLSSKWFSALDAAGVSLAAQPVERRELPSWIGRRLARQGQKLTPEALAFFTDRVEGNLLAARQEIDKLALLHPAGELDLETVQAAVANVARFDVFKLSESWLAGDAARAVRMLAGLEAEGEAVVLVLWSVAEELRSLLRIRVGLKDGRPLAQLMRDNRIWGERQKLVEPALRRLGQARLAAALGRCAEIDRAIKGAGAGDAWSLIRQLMLELCR